MDRKNLKLVQPHYVRTDYVNTLLTRNLIAVVVGKNLKLVQPHSVRTDYANTLLTRNFIVVVYGITPSLCHPVPRGITT